MYRYLEKLARVFPAKQRELEAFYRSIVIIRAALESKGARVLAGEVVDAGKLKGEALAMAARDIANALAAKLA
jgi:hypothetical protein